jgi:hypothetical protein
MRNLAGIKQLPTLAVGKDLPATDHARIEEIQVLAARPGDRSILIRYYEACPWFMTS